MSDEFLLPTSNESLDFSNQEDINKSIIDMTLPEQVVVSTPPTYDQAVVRAGKYHVGLGDQSPGKDVLIDSVLNGNEDAYRQQASQKQFVKEEELRAGFIREFIVNNPGATREELDLLRQVPLTKFKDPRSIFEEQYAKKVVDETINRYIQSGLVPESFGENQDKSSDVLNFAQQNIANYEYARKKYEEIDNRIKEQSYGDAALDYGAELIPFLKNYRMTNLLMGAVSSFIPGDNRQDQYTQYYLTDPETAAKMLDVAVEDLSSKNLHQAREYLAGLLHYSSNDRLLTNFGGLLDAATVPGSGKVISAVTRLSGATADVIRATNAPGVRAAAVLEAMGDTNKATLASVVAHLDEKAARTTTRLDSWEKIKNFSMPIFNPKALTEGGSSVLHGEQLRRLVDDMELNSASLLTKVVDQTIPINRVLENPEVLKTAVDETRRLWTIQYPWLDNAVLGVRPAYGEGKLVNSENIAIELGKIDGSLFARKTEAEFYATKWYGLRSYSIKERGDSFYVEILKPIDERSLNVYNELQVATNGRTPHGLINTYLGFLRSNEDTISKNLVNEGKVAQYGSSQLTNVIRQAAQDIGKLKDRQSFDTFLRRQQIQPNPTNPNVTGYRSKTVIDFERDWNSQFNRLPNEQEIKAYFSYTQLHSLDYMTRNLSIYNAKNRLGIEMFDFPTKGVKYKVNTVEGKLVDDIHIDKNETANILVWNEDPSQLRVINTRDNRFNRDQINLWRNSGHKIVQLSQYGDEHLRNLSPAVRAAMPEVPVQYVVSPKVKSSPIPLVQIPNRDGWHVTYPDDGFFVRQPNIKTSGGKTPTATYYGDVNVYQFADKAEADRYTHLMNQAREILITGDRAKLSIFLASNLPISEADFVRQFRQFDRSGKLDVSTPFYVTPSNVNVQQAHKVSDQVVNGSPLYPNFRDLKDSVYNLYKGDVNLAYATERDGPINTIVNLGSSHAPLLQMRTANTLDPVETINRSTAQLMRGRYLDDLKIKAAQEFVAEFGSLFDEPLEKLTRNPFYYLVNAEMRTTGVDRDLLAAAKNTRRAMINFLGLQTDFQKNVNYTLQRLSNDLLPKVVGKDGAEKVVGATKIVDGWLLGSLSDPGSFFRNVAFHAKMGMFNPTQLFKQAQTFTHIAGVTNPIDATKAMAAATLSRALEYTGREGILKNTAGRLVEWGWNKEHFIESYRAMERTGFHVIGREHSYLADFMNPTVLQGTPTKILNSGTIFFREGETLTRHAAWHTAYMQWRKANPTKALGDQDIRDLLVRADNLSVNMSHASNAPWQAGPTSVTGQFFGYATRLTEQMLSFGPNRRLTVGEKAKALAAYSAMYGIPVGIAGTALGAFGPVHEAYFSELRKRGIDADQNTILKVVNEGIPNLALSWVTGRDFDVKQSWGPNGNPFIRDFVENEKGFWGAMDLLGGAGFKTTREIGNHLINLIGVSGKKLLGITGDDVPVTSQDFIDVLNNASSFNQGRKLVQAVNIGEYVTKNEGTIIKDMTALQGVLMAMTGLEPMDISKMHGLIGDIKDQKKDWIAAQREADKYISLWVKEDKEDLKDQYLRRAKAALVIGGVPLDEQNRWLHRTLKSRQVDIINKLELDYAKGNPDRLKAFLNKETE